MDKPSSDRDEFLNDTNSESTIARCGKTYEEKIEAVNGALKEIGMGRYQWALFFLTGLGYFAGNLWPVVTALILPPVMNEFRSSNSPFLKLGQNIGLLVGAVFWGIGADIWGRKISFNVNLLITGVFGLAAGASPSFAVLTLMASLWSLGIGGNMPVDAAIFLEFIPSSHQYLLTVLSVWWTLGQFVGSLVAWPLMSKFSCPAASMTSTSPSSICDPESNKGWRYFLYSMGGLMLLFGFVRIFLFRISETPKYLVGKGRENEAIEVLEKVGKWNGKFNIWIDRESFGVSERNNGSNEKVQVKHEEGSMKDDWICEMKVNRVKPLFATREKTVTMSLLIAIWALIGLAFPLYSSFIPYYLATRGATFGDGTMDTTYRNQVILSVIGIPASLLAGYMVSLPLLGRRGTLAIFTLLTGVFILLSTTSRSSNALLAWNAAYTFTNNVMYGALYAMTNELFDSKERGTASALTSGANRIFGIMAPIIALYADLTTSVPIFIAGAIFVVAAVLPMFIPIETRDCEAR